MDDDKILREKKYNPTKIQVTHDDYFVNQLKIAKSKMAST